MSVLSGNQNFLNGSKLRDNFFVRLEDKITRQIPDSSNQTTQILHNTTANEVFTRSQQNAFRYRTYKRSVFKTYGIAIVLNERNRNNIIITSPLHKLSLFSDPFVKFERAERAYTRAFLSYKSRALVFVPLYSSKANFLDNGRSNSHTLAVETLNPHAYLGQNPLEHFFFSLHSSRSCY